jgi:ribosomal protein S27AE
MKNGTCPKCGCACVYHVEKRYPEPRGVIGVTLWSRVPVDDYVCGSCGFVESYLNDLGDLEQVKKRATVPQP